MPQLIEPKDLPHHAIDNYDSADDWRSIQRERLTLLLDAIASEVTTALQETGLTMPIFFTVPSTGDALLIYATPLDPSDSAWLRAGEIVIDIIGDKIDGVSLRHRELPCAAAGVMMGAADLCIGNSDLPEPNVVASPK